MFNEIKFTEATRKLIDQGYYPGDSSKGLDCVAMLFAIYGDILPKEWNGWTLENYNERWERGEGRIEFIEWLKTLGTPVEKNFMRKGDLIIYGGDESWAGAGIYLGSGLVIRVFNDEGDLNGGKPFPLRFRESTILEVRRLI